MAMFADVSNPHPVSLPTRGRGASISVPCLFRA